MYTITSSFGPYNHSLHRQGFVCIATLLVSTESFKLPVRKDKNVEISLHLYGSKTFIFDTCKPSKKVEIRPFVC